MSTKTTFKRIALVAVAAMGFGLMTAIPSNAVVVAQADSLTGAAATSATTGTAATTNLVFSFIAAGTQDMSISSAVLSSPLTSSVIALTYAKTASSTSANTTYASTAVVSPTLPDIRTTAYITASFTPDASGTYVIRFTPVGGTNNTPITWTVTAVSPVYNHSKLVLAGANGGSLNVDGAVIAPAAPAIGLANIGTITVNQYSSADDLTGSTAAIAQAVTVSISKGLVGLASGNYYTAAPSVTTAAATAGSNTYLIYTNGNVGTATVTASVGGVVVGTKTVIFQGTAVSLTVSATHTTIGDAVDSVSPKTQALVVAYLDAAGNTATDTPAVTCTSANTAAATVSGLTVSGVAAGSSVITCASTGLTSGTITMNVAPGASVTATTITFDKDSYSPGELMTITISAAAADMALYPAFVASSVIPSENIQTITGSPVGAGTVALVNGTATWKAYAPLATGPLTITGTSTTGTTTAVTASTMVAADTTAADAAAEATDAANAATDAANAAAEAADAATAAAQDAADAVVELSAKVATLIAGLKAQLTALTNLVIKIQKKVKA